MFFIETPLYRKTDNGVVLYKKPNEVIPIEKIKDFSVPNELLISEDDIEKSYNEISKNFYELILKNLNNNNKEKVIGTITEIANDIYKDPKYGSSVPARGLVGGIIRCQFENKELIKLLLNIASIDYTTVIHSITVMALLIRYGIYKKLDSKEIERLALLGFLHDIGKTTVPFQVVNSTRQLTETELEIIRKHPIEGSEILKKNGINNIVKGVLEHHEREDGSGYPYNLIGENISKDAKLLSIVDSYEAMTSSTRLYGVVKAPYEALKELREMSLNNKYDFNIYSDFVRSFSI